MSSLRPALKARRATAFLLPVVALSALLAGCVRLATIDATAEIRYRGVIGREYELRQDFLACGVKHTFPSAGFDEVTILPPPGLGGRYIVPLGRIPAGRRFRIVGVTDRRSDLLKNPEYVVAFSNHEIPGAAGKPVRIYHVSPMGLYEKPASPGAAPGLSPRYFRAVDGTPP